MHVYGVHYDMDEVSPGHPVFHAQFRTQAAMASVIEDRFRLRFDSSCEDMSQGLLRNVRVPTAQMDIFSVITQIGADHLLAKTSGPEVRTAFGRLRGACDFFLGAGARAAYLSKFPASHCYRSTHWYERADDHSEDGN